MAEYTPTSAELAPMVDDSELALLLKIAAMLYGAASGAAPLVVTPV